MREKVWMKSDPDWKVLFVDSVRKSLNLIPQFIFVLLSGFPSLEGIWFFLGFLLLPPTVPP